MKTLEIQNLTCKYDEGSVLSDLNLALEDNEIVCLLGASGCGKTTLLKAIAGLIPVQQGAVNLNGQNITHEPIEKRNVGMIFQDYALFPHLSVQDNIGFGLRSMSKEDRKQRIADMMTLVHLEGLEKRYPHELSGGQQQRVAIARSLACEPKCLLLDEPFSNIDSQVRTQLIQEMRSILKNRGIPAIFVTHSKDEAFVFADRLAILNNGGIVQVGDAQTLYDHPHTRFVAEFMGGVNYVPVEKVMNDQLFTALGVLPLSSVGNEYKQGAVLMLRPEDVVLSTEGYADASQCIHGIIKEKVFHGAFYSYVVAIGDLELKVNQADAFEVGQSVCVSVVLGAGNLLAE